MAVLGPGHALRAVSTSIKLTFDKASREIGSCPWQPISELHFEDNREASAVAVGRVTGIHNAAIAHTSEIELELSSCDNTLLELFFFFFFSFFLRSMVCVLLMQYDSSVRSHDMNCCTFCRPINLSVLHLSMM